MLTIDFSQPCTYFRSLSPVWFLTIYSSDRHKFIAWCDVEPVALEYIWICSHCFNRNASFLPDRNIGRVTLLYGVNKSFVYEVYYPIQTNSSILCRMISFPPRWNSNLKKHQETIIMKINETFLSTESTSSKDWELL